MQRWLKWCTGSHWGLEPFTSPNKCYRIHKAQKLVEFEAWKCTILVIYRLLDFPKSPSLLDMSTSRSSASQEAPGLHPTPLHSRTITDSKAILCWQKFAYLRYLKCILWAVQIRKFEILVPRHMENNDDPCPFSSLKAEASYPSSTLHKTWTTPGTAVYLPKAGIETTEGCGYRLKTIPALGI